MSEFIKAMKTKYPNLDIEKAIEIYENQISEIIPFPGKEVDSIGIKTDLAKNVFIKSMDEYIKRKKNNHLNK